MATPTNKQLREFILASFNENELYTFCFDYFEGVEHHFSDGMPMLKKVIELISYCNRHQIRENLLVALEQERPQTFRAAFPKQQSERYTRPRAYVPQPRNPRQVFVSHASADAELAHRIVSDLARNGFDIFITPDSIQPGEKWVPAINRGLEESGIFVVLLTPAAVQSGWVQDETNTAISLANAGQIRLFILDVAPCQPPILWRQRQFVSFPNSNYQKSMESLITALTDVKTSAPQPTKQPPRAGEYIDHRPRGGKVQNARIVTIEPGYSPMPPTQKPGTVKQSEPVHNSFIHEKTGLEFVWIPAGEFLYGDDKKTITLPEYWISKTPVTQAVYQRFIAANSKQSVPNDWNKQKRTFPDGKAEHPVIYVNWYDVVAFCEWAGLQLPTEEQWEKAARGTDGYKYPWGNPEPTDKHCNFNRNVDGTTPVGQFSSRGDSPYGCVDMSGNVWEWCLNKYKTPEVTTIEQSSDWRVLRGGSWTNPQSYVLSAVRNLNPPVNRNFNLGFRVVLRRPPSQ